jgi:hypothetical protein
VRLIIKRDGRRVIYRPFFIGVWAYAAYRREHRMLFRPDYAFRWGRTYQRRPEKAREFLAKRQP